MKNLVPIFLKKIKTKVTFDRVIWRFARKPGDHKGQLLAHLHQHTFRSTYGKNKKLQPIKIFQFKIQVMRVTHATNELHCITTG